jgi:hypothetical protein
MTAKVIDLNARRPRPLAKAQPMYPRFDDGVTLTRTQDGAFMLTKHEHGQSRAMLLTFRELLRICDAFRDMSWGEP